MSKELDIQTLESLMTLARGGSNLAQNILKEIFTVQDIQQKSFFPTAVNQQKQTYLKMCAKFFYDEKYPEIAEAFEVQSEWDAKTWQGYKGELVKQYTEMLKKGTDLSAVLVPGQQAQGQPQEKKRFWQRSKNEGETLE